MALSTILQMEQLQAIQTFVYSIPAFPYLWIPHCILMSMAARATVGGLKFSRTHPLACYMMAIVYTYPGGILASLLLAEPPLAFMANTPSMIVMTTAWYLVFYAPYDFFVKLIGLLHIKFPLGFLQDVLRIQLVISGVQTIHAIYPNSVLYPFVFATVKSSGFMFIKYAEALIFNPKLPKGFMVPNHHSKTCILAAVLFIASDVGYLQVDKKTLFLLCVLISLSLRLASMLPAAHVEPDPYMIFENVTCYVLFGQNEEQQENKSCDTTTEPNANKDEKLNGTGGKNKAKGHKVVIAIIIEICFSQR